MTETITLDAWAILSYLENNPATVTQLDQSLSEASNGRLNLIISWINIGEIEYILRRRQGAEEAEEVLNLLKFLPIEHIAVTPERIHQAAAIKSSGGLSYADAFVIASARERDAQIMTGDPEIIEFCPSDELIDLS